MLVVVDEDFEDDDCNEDFEGVFGTQHLLDELEVAVVQNYFLEFENVVEFSVG